MACQKRLLIAVLLAASLAVPAQARDRRHDGGDHRHHGGGSTAAIIGGVIGLGLGAAIIGSTYPPPAYYPPPPAYYPPPGYYPPPPPTNYYGAPY